MACSISLEATLLAAQEEEQERQVEERERRKRGLTHLVGRHGPLLGHVVAPFEQGAHRRPQRRPPQVPGSAQRLGEPAERKDLGIHRRHVAGREEIEDAGAVCGQQRRHRSRRAGPVEQLGRLVELLVEWRLADDERVVKDRGRRAERSDVVETTRTIER